jgi:hypothetical protein
LEIPLRPFYRLNQQFESTISIFSRDLLLGLYFQPKNFQGRRRHRFFLTATAMGHRLSGTDEKQRSASGQNRLRRERPEMAATACPDK